MIKLTGKSGIAIYINPDKIIGINAYAIEPENGSFINYGSDQYIVTESPEEVTRKILEYKLAMARYPLAVAHDTKDGLSENVDEIYRLAGLEE